MGMELESGGANLFGRPSLDGIPGQVTTSGTPTGKPVEREAVRDQLARADTGLSAGQELVGANTKAGNIGLSSPSLHSVPKDTSAEYAKLQTRLDQFFPSGGLQHSLFEVLLQLIKAMADAGFTDSMKSIEMNKLSFEMAELKEKDTKEAAVMSFVGAVVEGTFEMLGAVAGASAGALGKTGEGASGLQKFLTGLGQTGAGSEIGRGLGKIAGAGFNMQAANLNAEAGMAGTLGDSAASAAAKNQKRADEERDAINTALQTFGNALKTLSGLSSINPNPRG